MIGKTISHYRVIQKLGEGGMGVVYKAEDENLHRPVALKFLRADAIGNRQIHGRFWKEAEAAAALDHPNITTVHEIAEADGQIFIAMAFIEGESLAAKIKQRPLPLDEALGIARQVGEAVQAAHQRGIVHRDIKPSNIMVTPEGRVKVMDFGLAHLAGQTRITKTGTIMGTPAYMSPEQARGEEVDHRSDIWSLGVVLYEMVTGKLPFHGDSDQAVLFGIINETHEPMTAIRVGTPTELDRIAGKALAKYPDERYQHADEFVVDLKQLKVSTVKTGAKMQPSAVRRTGWGMQLAAGIGLIAFGALLSWLYLARTGEQSAGLENMRLRRITADNGLAMQPTVSPSGEFVIYSSDRAGESHLDLWLQQVGGGEPVRLTSDPADELQPAFSPDGRQIAFRSDKNGGGIYVMPALGGEPRFLAASGRRPRFSPDGESIVYWTGQEHNVINNAIHVISTTGGEPRELFAGKYPVWSPDGSRILFVGDREDMSQAQRNWFIGDPSTRIVLPVDALPMLFEQGLGGEPVDQDRPFLPSAWNENGEVLFSAQLGDSWNIWALRLTPILFT